MHLKKGFGRRGRIIWVVVTIIAVVVRGDVHVLWSSNRFKYAERLTKANEVYYVNDKGSSVAIR